MERSQKKMLASAALIVMSSQVLSRITGFLRSTFIPNIIADKAKMDAFGMSFRITDFMFNLLLGGAISAAVIPVLSGYLARKEENEGWKAVSTFINVTMIAMVFVSIIGIIFSPQIVGIMAPKFTYENKQLTISLTRILFPSVCFMMLAGMMNGVLNSYQRFAAAAYGPSIYNIGSALSLLFLGRFGVKTVVWGIMCSAAMYFLVQMLFALKNMKLYRPKIYLKHPGYQKLFKLAIPSIATSSVMQIDALISAYFAGLFVTGTVASYSMANELWQMPFGIFAVGIGVAMLPAMSEKIALGNIDEFKAIFSKGLKFVLLFAVPSSIGMISLNVPIISVVYKWVGKFDVSLISQVSPILIFFSIAIITQSMIVVINRAFFAANDTKTPFFMGLITVLLTISMNFSFYKFTDMKSAGMSLAYSLASMANVILTILLLDRKVKGIGLKSLLMFMIKVLSAAGVMGILLYSLNLLLPINYKASIAESNKLAELLVLFAEVIAGTCIYFCLVLLMKVDEAVYGFNVFKNNTVKILSKVKNKFTK